MARLLAVAAAAVATLLTALPVSADTASDLAAAQARKQAIDAVRAQLGSQLATAIQAQEQLAEAIRANITEQQKVEAEIADSDAKLAQLDQDLARLHVEETATQSRIDTEREQVRELARAIYVQPSSVLLLLVQSRSVGEMITRINDLRSAGARANKLKAKLDADMAKLEQTRRKEFDDRIAAQQLRDKQVSDLATLQDLRTKQDHAQADLARQIQQTRAELLAVKSQSEAVAKQIVELLEEQQAAVIAAAMQAVWDQAQASGVNYNASKLSTGHSTRYRFVWPEASATETQPFGPSDYWFEPPFYGYAHFHTGIDMASGLGTDIRVADDGVVIEAGCSCVNGQPVGYGYYVIVAHTDGLATLYGHMSLVVVKEGQVVNQGDVVGKEGSTGNSTGPHLHFELRKGGQPIDPRLYLPPGTPSNFHD